MSLPSDPEAGDCFFVELDAETRLLRNIQIAVTGTELLLRDRLPKIGLLFRNELADERVWNRVEPMQRGSHVDVCGEAMIRHRQAAVPGECSDLGRFREAAAAR